MTKHDPTDEAETLPGIPKAGSDLEQFPSVPGLLAGGGALDVDVAMQEVTSLGSGDKAAPTVVAISAVVLSRTYAIVQGSQQGHSPVSGGSIDHDAERFQITWELTTPTTLSWWTHIGAGLTKRVVFNVIEYL